MENQEILSEITHVDGYLIRVTRSAMPNFEVVELSGGKTSDDTDELIDALTSVGGEIIEMTSAYTLDGCYIGTVEEAEKWFGRGIVPELHPKSVKEESHCCSIGFCEKEQKWYGWSHRAWYGFGIGSVTKEGHCGYQAPTKESYGRNMMNFFCDRYLDPAFKDSVSADGVKGVLLSATYPSDTPNEKLRGTQYENFQPYPERFGRGEWVAETLEDAKQMAADFAEGVS